MRIFYYFIFIAIIFLRCAPNSKGQNVVGTEKVNLNYTVIQYDSTINWVFKNSIQADLNKDEITLVTEILTDCLDNHNSNLKTRNKNSKRSDLIEIDDYNVQLVPIYNQKGEKEVWVNCFCRNSNEEWNEHIVFVLDGGKCYFNLKINLTLKKYYEFQVNGEA
jgi:hypothetical protein